MKRETHGFLIFILQIFIWIGIFVGIAYAQTPVEVGGVISGTQVWTKEFIYIVVDDILVPEGAELKILAGTQVRFEQRRSIKVDGGGFIVEGIENDIVDTVQFIPNHSEPGQVWTWGGISIKSTFLPGSVQISYAHIADAEYGIEIVNSTSIHIQNSCIENNYWRGISLVNCTLIQLRNCHINKNYVGIEVIGRDPEGASTDNLISDNMVSSITTNILFINDNGGKCARNIISNNVIQNGNNGIWLDNSGNTISYRNVITQNAIINNRGGTGYGLYLAMDSTQVTENIFWHNDIALSFRNASNSVIQQNTYYENGRSLPMRSGSKYNRVSRNTFTENLNEVVSIEEATGIQFHTNNIMHNALTEKLVLNLTEQNVSAPENYWGTTDEAQIASLIYDKHDDPSLGELIYRPNLLLCDTTAPISPPYRVKKQWVDSRVRVSWIASEEADLLGYNLYYKNFVNYSFGHVLNNLNQNSVFADDLSMDDTIAVTSFDRFDRDNFSKFLGHESAFAFADPAPFAGKDTAICANGNAFTTNEANIPFANTSLNWTSSGDGGFSNPFILTTMYHPGIKDYEQGLVILSLNVTTETEFYSESFVLSFFEKPLLFAGNDTIINLDSTFHLSNAMAEHYTSLLWTSLGDGQFDQSNILHPVYTPGPEDQLHGEVVLILGEATDCGYFSDTLTVGLLPEFSLEGRVWFREEVFQQAIVLAYHVDSGNYRPMIKTRTASDGSFRFERLFKGSYVLFALPDTITEGAASCYYANHAHWEETHQIILNEPAYDVDITLPAHYEGLPLGNGHLSGIFELPLVDFRDQSVYCSDWLERDTNILYCDGGLSNISINLYDPGFETLFAYTLTDARGQFFFNQLPFGNYRLQAELPGFPVINSPIIELNPSAQSMDSVIIQIETKKIGIYLPGRDVIEDEETVDFYPNPVQQNLHLILTGQAKYTLYISDSFGRQVMSQQLNASLVGHNEFSVDVLSLPRGLYLGVLMSGHDFEVFKFIKN